MPNGNILLASSNDSAENDRPVLWITDGTTSGTRIVRTFDRDPLIYLNSAGDVLGDGSVLLFESISVDWADPGVLWVSDGTRAGTVKVSAQGFSQAYTVALIDGLVLVVNTTDPFGDHAELWVTDGTSAGAVPIRTDFEDLGVVDGLDGVQGRLAMFGGGGNDIIRGDADNDTLGGEAGRDTLDGGNGADSLSGGTGNDVLRGGDGRDTLLGGTGRDTLAGGLGGDVLDGGSEADIYRFAIPGDGVGTIIGFTSSDEIQLARSGFGLPLGALADAAFQASGGAVAKTAAVRFVYQTTTGHLFHDPDGDGAAAVLLAVLESAPALSSTDLVVIA